jgi:hypothetical protein
LQVYSGRDKSPEDPKSSDDKEKQNSFWRKSPPRWDGYNSSKITEKVEKIDIYSAKYTGYVGNF